MGIYTYLDVERRCVFAPILLFAQWWMVVVGLLPGICDPPIHLELSLLLFVEWICFPTKTERILPHTNQLISYHLFERCIKCPSSKWDRRNKLTKIGSLSSSHHHRNGDTFGMRLWAAFRIPCTLYDTPRNLIAQEIN